MKKKHGVSPTDYEWLKYNLLVEISSKLSILITQTKIETTKDGKPRKCDECNNDMVWAILSNKWICLECGHVLTIDDIVQMKTLEEKLQ